MTSTIDILYPEIPFESSEINTSHDYDTAHPVHNLTSGARGNVAKLATATGQQTRIEFDLGSGVTKSADYMAIVRADLLQGELVDQVALKGSNYSIESSNNAGPVAIFDFSNTTAVTSDASNRISSVTYGAYSAVQSTDAAKPTISRSDNQENLFLYSEALDDANWTKTRCSVSANVAVDPVYGDYAYGSIPTVDEVIEDTSASNSHRVHQYPGVWIGQEYTFVIFVKRGSGSRHFSMGFDGGDFGGATQYAHFDMSDGTLSSKSASVTATDGEDLGDGWFRFRALCTATATGASGGTFYLTDTPGNTNYTGDGVSSLYIFGAQFKRSFASSIYQPTTSLRQWAGVNGLATAVFDGSDDELHADSIAASFTGEDQPFTCVVALRSFDLSSANDRYIMSFGSSSSANPYIYINELTNDYYSDIRDDGATGASVVTANVVASGVHILTIKSSGTAITTYFDGVEQTTAGAADVGTLTLNQWTMGCLRRTTSSGFYPGQIGEIQLYDYALSDATRESVEGSLLAKWSNAPMYESSHFASETLYGPKTSDFLTTFSETSAYRYWWLELRGDPIGSISSKLPISKLLIGKREKLEYTDATNPKSGWVYPLVYGLENRSSAFITDSGYKYPARTGPSVLTLGISAALGDSARVNLLSKILQNRDICPIMLYAADSTFQEVLHNYKVLFCWIDDFAMQNLGPIGDNNVLNLVLREAI